MAPPPPSAGPLYTAPAPTSAGLALPYASVARRAIAWLLDMAIVGVAVGGVLMERVQAWAYAASGVPTYYEISDFDANLVVLLIALIGTIEGFYAIVLESFGVTLGKLLMGIKIVTQSGGKPGIGRSLGRNLLRGVDALPAFYLLGAIIAGSSKTKQRLGDYAAGTYVVRRRS